MSDKATRSDMAPSSQATGFVAALKALGSQRRLTVMLVQQELQARYAGASLGGLWNWLMPLVMLGVYALVFGQILQARWPMARTDSHAEFVATLFAGLLVVNLFNDMVGRAASLLPGHANLIKKVVFPVQVLPMGLAGVAILNAAIALVLLAGLQLLSQGQVWASWLALPLILLPVVLLGLGCTWWVSASAVFLRDLGPLVQAFLSALVFLTPVFYPLSALPERWRGWMSLNPLAVAVEQLRAAAIYGQWPQWNEWAWAAGSSAVVALVGLWWFDRLRDGFADVL